MKKIICQYLDKNLTEIEKLNLQLALNPSRDSFLNLDKNSIELLDWDFIFEKHYERKKKHLGEQS